MEWIVILSVLMLLPVALLAERAFRRLLQIQKRDFPALWEANGGASGFFHLPSEPKPTRSPARLWVKWLLFTPPWAKSHAQALSALRRFRIAAACWYVGILVWTFFLQKYAAS